MNEIKINSRNSIGKRAGIVGIGVNILLFVIKAIAGILAGSVSIIADAVNNLTDAGSSILVMLGYIISSKPADREHPFGHARMEYLCSLFISVIVTALGIEFLRSSVDSLISVSRGEGGVNYGTLQIVIMAVAIAVKILLALFYKKTSVKIGSEALKASAVDSIGDVCASTAVIIGILLTPVIGPSADGIFGIIVAVYILIMGIKLIKDSSNTLLGTPPDIELIRKIVNKIKSYDGVLGIHDLVIHNYGVDSYFASVHVEVDADRDIMQSHDIIDNIEVDLKENMGIHLVIHMDPITISDERVIDLQNKTRDILDEISAEYSSAMSMHDFRVVFGVTHSNIIFDIAVSHDFPLQNSELVEMLRDEAEKKLGEQYKLVITIDRDYTTNRY